MNRLNCLITISCLFALSLPLNAQSGNSLHSFFKKWSETPMSSEQIEQCMKSLEWNDIPQLLELAASPVVLANCPANPLSSYLQSRCSQRAVALWFVESIRLLRVQYRPQPYPSLNPVLRIRGTHIFQPIAVESSYEDIFIKYKHWWNSDRPVEEKASLNPLKGSNLRWH